MKGIPKLIVFHQSLHKPPSSTHRLYLLTFFFLFTITFFLTLLKSTSPPQPPPPPYTSPPDHLTAALLHYATVNSTVTGRMTASEVNTIVDVIKHCRPRCMFLVFGFSHETLLWNALNFGEGRRTVFVDESEFMVNKYENNCSHFEAYDVHYTTKVHRWKEMIKYSRTHRTGECRPTQNLLFSDCQLAINDLPNHLYEIPWDVILIDGPRGYSPEMPGRMAPVYTAAVMSRTRRRARTLGKTHVFVHDYEREIERVYSEEFLCKENLVDVGDNLAHFVVEEREENDKRFEFCERSSLSSY